MRQVYWLPLLLCAALAYGTEPVRQPALMVSEYNGKFQDAFAQQFDRVRLLTRQAQMEASSRLGLFQYREGFRNPFRIRFEDTAPEGLENAFAFVRLMKNDRNEFCQELVVNLSVTRNDSNGFDKVFYHEMTHAVLNDAIGGEASTKVPYWVQEGLALYVSEEGDPLLKRACASLTQLNVHVLLYDLDGAYSGRAYPQYYLAIKYIYEKYSSNAIQTFVRQLIEGKPCQDALQEATSVSWDRFQKDLRDYSLTTLKNIVGPRY